MKLSFTFFLGTLAMTKAKSLRGGNKKLMPNGMSCNYCPDDDDYVWPPDYSWHPPPIDRKLKVENLDQSVPDDKASNLEEASLADVEGNERALKGKGKLMPNGMSCNYCPDDDDYVWPPDYSWHPPPIDRKLKTDDIDHNVSVLEAAAEAAAYEASFLESLANHRDLADDKKNLYKEAAKMAKYEASVLEEAAVADIQGNERLLKGKLMPNGMSCNYCPDDDDYVWPPDYSWHPPPIDRKLESAKEV